MASDVHDKLGRSMPIDTLIPNIYAQMKEAEPEQWKKESTIDKLKRVTKDEPLKPIDPLI